MDSLQIDLCPIVFLPQFITLGNGGRLAVPQGAVVVALVEIASGDNVDLHRFVCVLRVSYRGDPSVAVADVPDSPLSTIGVSVAGLDCLQTLGAGVLTPEGEVGASVAVVPDLVRLVDGHLLCLN